MEKSTGFALFRQQFKAMFYKRVIFTWRNKILTLSQIVLPLFFTGITVAITETLPDRNGIAPSMPINMDIYQTTQVYIPLPPCVWT